MAGTRRCLAEDWADPDERDRCGGNPQRGQAMATQLPRRTAHPPNATPTREQPHNGDSTL